MTYHPPHFDRTERPLTFRCRRYMFEIKSAMRFGLTNDAIAQVIEDAHEEPSLPTPEELRALLGRAWGEENGWPETAQRIAA